MRFFHQSLLTLASLSWFAVAGCGAASESGAEEVGDVQSDIVAGTVVTTADAEREGLANVNFLADVVKSGSGVVVNRRYVITAKHVVGLHVMSNGQDVPSQYEVVMGNQRSRVSKVWDDSQADLSVLQVDPPLTVHSSSTYERPLATRSIVVGDQILMAGASPNGATVTANRPSRYAWLPVISAGGSSYWVGQTAGNPINSDPVNGNVHICWFGDSGGANLLYQGGVANLAGITSLGAGSLNGWFDSCGSVDVFSRSNFIKPLIADKKNIYFAPSWNVPYDNSVVASKAFNPCNGACYKLDYNYELEQGYDMGTVATNIGIFTYTGTGSASKQVCGTTTIGINTDYSVQKRGFYDVKATCN